MSTKSTKAKSKAYAGAPEPMATPEEVAARLRVEVQTLYVWRH